VAQARGARSVYLEVRQTNAVARRMYETGGFEVVGVRRKYYSEPVEDAIVMRLDLHDTAR
jgi:ribosomal-protein-alanine N-acetyltransferase